MDEGKREAPRPNLNRCARCYGKHELFRIEGVKGTFCKTCEEAIKRALKLKRICVHRRPIGECGKKACVVRHVMES